MPHTGAVPLFRLVALSFCLKRRFQPPKWLRCSLHPFEGSSAVAAKPRTAFRNFWCQTNGEKNLLLRTEHRSRFRREHEQPVRNCVPAFHSLHEDFPTENHDHSPDQTFPVLFCLSKMIFRENRPSSLQ